MCNTSNCQPMPHICGWSLKHKTISKNTEWKIDSTAVSIFVVILIELTNTIFVNSTNITTNIETAVLSKLRMNKDNIQKRGEKDEQR